MYTVDLTCFVELPLSFSLFLGRSVMNYAIEEIKNVERYVRTCMKPILYKLILYCIDGY